MLECRRRQSEDVDEDRCIEGREKEADGIGGLSFSGDVNVGKIVARSRSMGWIFEELGQISVVLAGQVHQILNPAGCLPLKDLQNVLIVVHPPNLDFANLG